MKTLAWRKVPKWRRDPFILGSYRRTKADVWEILASLTYLHNETVNVYTHLVGATLLPLAATTVMRMLSQPQFINVSETDYTMFRIFFCSAEFCLICSTMYHLASPYSRKVERFWHRMDLLGIVIATAGTFIPSIYYIFFCEAAVQRLHWCIVTILAVAIATLACWPAFGTSRWREVRVAMYVAFGTSAFIPLLHGVYLHGLAYMLQHSGMKWYILELAIYGAGATVYAFRVPECWFPGLFDVVGSSHQVFHLCIVSAMSLHIWGQIQAFTACHTLDICGTGLLVNS